MIHNNLREAWRAVMQEVTYVQKTEHKGVSYTVATEADVIAALRPSMVEHGIVMAPIKVEQLESGHRETKTGNAMFSVRLAVTYRFQHVHSDDHIDVMMAGEAANVGDKGTAAAMTMAQKYALLEFFLIERGNDPETVVQHRDDENANVYRGAVTAIERCSTEAKLNDVLERVRTNCREDGELMLTPDQISELAMVAEKHRIKLRGIGTREQTVSP